MSQTAMQFMGKPIKQTLMIPNRLPGMNDIIAWSRLSKGKWNKYSTEKKKIGKKIAYLVIAQKLVKISRPVDIIFHWHELQKGKMRDKDNICSAKKFVLDGLVESGILGGDDWKFINSFRDEFYAGDQESVIIEIQEREG